MQISTENRPETGRYLRRTTRKKGAFQVSLARKGNTIACNTCCEYMEEFEVNGLNNVSVNKE